VIVGLEHAAQVHLVLSLLLLLDRVGARAVGLPCVDHGAGQRIVQRIRHLAVDEDRDPLPVIGEVRAERLARGVVEVEGPEVRSLRRAALGVDHVDQRRETEHVAQQDEFVPLGRGDLPAIIEEHQHLHPLVMGELMFARVVVQMLDQAVKKLLEPASRLGLEGAFTASVIVN
jgi:hypothetical protein